jgi:predicted CXXCH cytochrome family protein
MLLRPGGFAHVRVFSAARIIDHGAMLTRIIVVLGAASIFLITVGCQRPDEPGVSHYVGSPQCAQCHAGEYAAWLTSHHRRAMQPATAESVLGDFHGASLTTGTATVRFGRDGDRYQVGVTDAEGRSDRFAVNYTFGVEPLQQYLLETGNGRLQALTVAWDSRPAAAGGQRWMDLQAGEVITPDDPMHWTGVGFNWNHMCADCHSTGVRKAYDEKARTFATRYDEVTVGCEACHGPGSGHVGWLADTAPSNPGPALAPLDDPAAELNACAACHSRRSQLAEGFAPTAHYLDHYLPALLEPDLYHSDGQILDEVFEFGSFLQSRMHAAGVRCSQCHDPHSARLRFDGDAVCTQCHNPAGHADFPSLARRRYDTTEHHFHAPESQAARCVSCHMASRTYMRVDDRRDHSFRLPRPDLSAALGVPNACTGCHADEGAGWAADAIAARFGPRRPAHFAAAIHDGRRGRASAETALVEVAGDPSHPAIVRATALSLLGQYDGAVSDIALRDGLRDPDPLVQLGAIAASGRWPPELRWRQVAPLLEAPRRAVRSEAARVLAPMLPRLEPSAAAALAGEVESYRQTLRLHADRAEAQTALASLYGALGRLEEAEAALAEALRIHPGYLPALLNLADLYRASGRDALADVPLRRARESAPDSAAALTARGLWLVRQQRSTEALEHIERAWRLEPDRASSAYLYAVALHSAGDAAAALSVLDDALEHDPGHRQLLETAIAFARDRGDLSRVRAYQTALHRR